MKAYDGRGEGTTIRDKILDYLGFNSEEKKYLNMYITILRRRIKLQNLHL